MKTLKEKIEVMQAFLDGKEIEIYNDVVDPCYWESIANPEFNWEYNDYRIKPEPVQVPFNISDYESRLGKKMRHVKQKFTGILTCVEVDKLTIGNKDFLIQFATPHLQWYNDLLTSWESCTKTVKG